MALFGKKFGKGKDRKEEKKIQTIEEMLTDAGLRLSACPDVKSELSELKNKFNSLGLVNGDSISRNYTAKQTKNREAILAIIKSAINEFAEISDPIMSDIRHKNFVYINKLLNDLAKCKSILLVPEFKKMQDDIWAHEKEEAVIEADIRKNNEEIKRYQGLIDASSDRGEIERYGERISEYMSENDGLDRQRIIISNSRVDIQTKREVLKDVQARVFNSQHGYISETELQEIFDKRRVNLNAERISREMKDVLYEEDAKLTAQFDGMDKAVKTKAKYRSNKNSDGGADLEELKRRSKNGEV